jgi:hypothetical protein
MAEMGDAVIGDETTRPVLATASLHEGLRSGKIGLTMVRATLGSAHCSSPQGALGVAPRRADGFSVWWPYTTSTSSR